ncbi:unnamed protein product [Rhizoctonia solani]|uniref:N-acetyltransferase domain-containing protein n=1 Tax=Rhizoctonia solani TaxID=456999 RepID=A0A8H3CGL1_9AGAM|nr:unnamed protein product [Rhizoctonia solani]
MWSRQTTSLKVYGSRRGVRSSHKPHSQAVFSHEDAPTTVVSDSGLLQEPKASISTLKRKSTSTTNLHSFFGASHPIKKLRLAGNSQKSSSSKQTSRNDNGNASAPTLTQLHFLPSKSILVTCKSCDLSYTRGAKEDEELHRAHCLRVARGMEWSREERSLEKPRGTEMSDVELVEERCILPNGVVGRILRIRCDVTKGKLGQKVTTLLSTVNKVLSAPSLPYSSLKVSKVYVMVIPTEPSKFLGSQPKNDTSAARFSAERLVGCVVATHIADAMRIVDINKPEASNTSQSDLVCVDNGSSGGNVYCDPNSIPATLGIARLFVVPSHRRQGIARALLDAAAKTAIWGCPLDPTSGQIAFSQPTTSGYAVMKEWGGHNIRIYEE